MDGDPWEWDVSQVGEFFQNRAAEWVQDLPHSKLPDLEPFVQALEENDVSGAVLLNGSVDGAFLRDDCGLRSLGVRSSILHCIHKLRAEHTLRESQKVEVLGTPQSLPAQLPPSLPRPPSQSLPPQHQQPLNPGQQDPVSIPVFDAVEKRAREGESTVEDAKGRKRRRLNLTQPVSQPQSRTDIAPPVSYMRDAKLSVNELFYGDTPFGRTIPEDCEPERGFQEGTEEGLEYWHVEGYDTLAGEAAYVYRQIRHFLQSERTVNLQRHGRDAVAVIPYRDSLVLGDEAQPATVIQFIPDSQLSDADADDEGDVDDEDRAVAVKESVVLLHTGGDYSNLPQDSTSGAWDFLAIKYGNRDSSKATPAPDADSASITSSLYAEIQAEDQEQVAALNRELDEEAMKSVIEQCIDQYIAEWFGKEEHKLQKRAWTVWRLTKQSKTKRDGLVAGARSHIASLDQRLARQQREILSAEYASNHELQSVCENMRVNVELREEQRWKISIWKSKQETYHERRAGQQSSSSKRGNASRVAPGFVVAPGDRFSVEPAPTREGENEAEEYHSAHSTLPEETDYPEDLAGPRSPLNDFIASSPTPETQSVMPSSEHYTPLKEPSSDSADETSSNSADETSPDLLPDVSTFVPPLDRKPQPNKSPQKLASSRSDPIEISSDSSTPSMKARKKKIKLVNNKLYRSTNPLDDANADQVRAWNIDELIKRQDRQRLLIKLLYTAGERTRALLRKYMRKLRPGNFAERLIDALHSLRENINAEGSNEQKATMITCGRIYVAYHYMFPFPVTKNTSARVNWTQVIRDKPQARFLSNLLDTILKRDILFLDSSPKAPLQADCDPHSGSGSDSDDDPDTPIKSRNASRAQRAELKRKTAQQQSQMHQQSARERQKKFQEVLETQTSNSQKLLAIAAAGASRSAVAVNVAREDGQAPIYFDGNIVESMMEHQIDGVQFMWRELTASADDGAQGCILAHTMGLGKTMQTITLLVALNEAARSKDPNVHLQLPSRLRIKHEERFLRTLIICPPSLINNWRNEIQKWASSTLPLVHSVESQPGRKDHHHLGALKEWHKYGGVLLIGYETFRMKVNAGGEDEKASKKKTKKTKKDLTEDATAIQEILLEGPELVVADEAHKLKSDDTGVTKAAKKLATQSRIALTGTPMSNDVQEIYSLVSFVAPEYLGEKKWFNTQFAIPIKEGNGKDSSAYQRRRGLKKLAVLHQEIEPKVHRANITVLRGSVTSKVEFHITLALTETQRAAYTKYVAALLGNTNVDKASQTAIFQWLALLTLLTNHPLAFKRRLLEPPVPSKPKAGRKPQESDGSVTPSMEGEGEGEGEDDETEAAVRNLGFDQDLINDIVSEIEDDFDPSLSAKMTVLMEIVQLSKACGDKLLIFTHRLPTLDYLAGLFQSSSVRYGRIDGRVPMGKRLDALAAFEKGKYDLLIISTRAGGVGLNIQTANRVVIMDAHFNPTYEEQAIGRAYRLGQTKPVFVYRLVMGGTFETNIWEKQVFKTGMALRVVDKKSTKRSGDINSREYLYSPREVPQDNVSQYLGKDEAVLDVILDRQLDDKEKDNTRHALIRSIETTETLQEEVSEPLTEEEKREVAEEYEQNARNRSGQYSNLFTGMPIHGLPISTAPPRAKSSGTASARLVVKPPMSSAANPAPPPRGGVVSLRLPQSAMRDAVPGPSTMGAVPSGARDVHGESEWLRQSVQDSTRDWELNKGAHVDLPHGLPNVPPHSQ